jgi:FOG: EAL domain
VGAENADWETIRRDISERFQQPWRAESVELNLNVTYVEIGLSGQDTTSDRIVNTLIYALDEAGESADIEQSVMSQETLQKFDAQIEIKRWLDQAIDNDQVEVFLQPIIDSHTRQVFFAEALARIRDDGGKLIPPGLFIPIAEKNGQINLLGEQVLRRPALFSGSVALKLRRCGGST